MVLGMMALVILGLFALVIIALVVIIYNGLISIRKNVDKAWSNIDVLLKQRNDEIPNLVDSVKGYMKHERETLVQIVEARKLYESSPDMASKAKASNMITAGLKTIFALSENYPNLRASENFMQLQSRVSGIENEIADRRELYNDSVTIYNTRIEQVPYNVFAGMLKYKSMETFKIAESERAVPKIKF